MIYGFLYLKKCIFKYIYKNRNNYFTMNDKNNEQSRPLISEEDIKKGITGEELKRNMKKHIEKYPDKISIRIAQKYG